MSKLITFAAMAGTALLLSGCGGRLDTPVQRAYATGPVQTACLRADRSAANRQLCGCVQAAADRQLSGGDQRRAVRFFKDPHHAQEVRQSDRPRDEAFWKRYKEFVASAERLCRVA